MYYNYQLSKAQQKFDDQVLKFVVFSWTTSFISSGNLADSDIVSSKCTKCQATILLPLETRIAPAHGNTITLSPNISVMPHSTDNCSISRHLFS